MHHEFIPEDGATGKTERYKEMLTCVWNTNHLNCCEMWVAKDWVILHDAPAQQSLLVEQQFTMHETMVHLHSLKGSLQGCSGGSSSLQECTAGGHAWWLPKMFQTTV